MKDYQIINNFYTKTTLLIPNSNSKTHWQKSETQRVFHVTEFGSFCSAQVPPLRSDTSVLSKVQVRELHSEWKLFKMEKTVKKFWREKDTVESCHLYGKQKTIKSSIVLLQKICHVSSIECKKVRTLSPLQRAPANRQIRSDIFLPHPVK